MTSLSFGNHSARWAMGIVALVFILACNSLQSVPAASIAEVTQVIPVTQIIQATKLVPVTRIVQVTHIVEVPQVVPASTEAPMLPIAPDPAPITPKANNDLFVWYNFEDDFLDTGRIADRSGNGLDAQINGTIDVSKGTSDGQAIFFSGDGYIQAQSNPVAGRNNISFSLWFKTDHPENNYKLASAAWWNGGPGSGWILATHIPEFWSDDTQSLYFPDIINNENYFEADKWIHEVITYDGVRINEYTNGQLVNDWIATGAMIGEGQSMVIGAWPPFSGFNFQGGIDEFQIFNHSLTEKEVQVLYKQGQ